MPNLALVAILAAIAALPAPDLLPTQPFTAPKYGVATKIPQAWTIEIREQEDRVFVATIPQQALDRPGIVACELGLAPESLDDYRTRIDNSAKKSTGRGGKLATNRIIKDKRGDRLETIWEFHPDAGGFWREVSVRLIAHRQLYTFILNVEDSIYNKVRDSFDALVLETAFTVPNTGAELLTKPANRWIQREYKFALDLPSGWSPVLAPSEVALLFANGPPHGVWSDNLLVIARPRPNRDQNLEDLARAVPDQLHVEDPRCEILSCKVVAQGNIQALETVVRTARGPFSMTVIERKFRGQRFDYEIKYTVESKRFDELAPKFRQTFDSFRELPGEVPGAPALKAA
jgi:hypothetical protein